MPFVAPDAVTWLADWDAGQPVTFSDPFPDRRTQTVQDVANAAAEILRMLIAADPNPEGWRVKELWRTATNDIRQDLRPVFRQWDIADVARAVDFGMTLYVDGPQAWFTDDVGHLVQVSKP